MNWELNTIEGSKWKTEHHFTSWLSLAPNTKISGGKIISSRIVKKRHYAGQAFRIAANSLWQSQSPLGDHYRRIRARAVAVKAVVATARKLAIIYYKMVLNKEAFNPQAMADFQQKYKDKKISQLKKKDCQSGSGLKKCSYIRESLSSSDCKCSVNPMYISSTCRVYQINHLCAR